ncbi:RlpA-like double-psi beta-barrel-protein domain-containing protein-containing protein [Podospora australis]|uniref:RlpA-like double-psi beta-barrel-protein domain-containing protein-containing protein n=1 Tax=Podospora australis TaxID=1536484 RepID=A0AAN7AF74_9PEZI|nr:RlpA-like double-psi beta-barrel-protein domain-containing protein-containing protein [Podospora australis]
MYFSKTAILSALLSALQLSAAAPSQHPSGTTATLVARQVRSGKITFYEPGLGSCGLTSSGSDLVAAIGKSLFDASTVNGNPNNNPLCGKKIRVTVGGKSVEVTAVDSCPACTENDLDLSPAAFNQLADPAEGKVAASWEFI